MNISVVTPVFSEDDSLCPLVDSLHKILGDNLSEIIIVYHPNSTDSCLKTLEILKKEYSKVTTMPQDLSEPGNGSAFRQGFAKIQGSHVLMIDSDGEMDVNTIPTMIKKMKQTRCDVVVSSRFMNGGEVKGYSFKKLILNRIFQYLFRVLYQTNLTDLTYGFKLIKTEVLKSIQWKAKFQDIGAETTLKPLKKGYIIQQVPTTWISRKAGGGNSLSIMGNLRYPLIALRILLNKE